MRNWIVSLSLSFLLLFLWQLAVLFGNCFFQEQEKFDTELAASMLSIDDRDSISSYATIDLADNCFVEEVLEEEIQPTEDFPIIQFIHLDEQNDHYVLSHYFLEQNPLFLPPEANCLV